ncbi:MAG: prenyltransferase/squalene oxidase repeat-containing protein [Pirellulaceae bacterium]|nr:prenyltransferase/squalene oxidase repeat-containing protein [Pirellulaceae bacterium]
MSRQELDNKTGSGLRAAIEFGVDSDVVALEHAWRAAQQTLLSQRGPEGYWPGHLSSSALSTATATMALDEARKLNVGSGPQQEERRKQCESGWHWLTQSQNPDGGWGDTTLSLSNISTTSLVWAALPSDDPRFAAANNAAEKGLLRAVNQSLGTQETVLIPGDLATAIGRRYGKDHTFSVPILTALALRGRLGFGPAAWKLIPQLPFELAAFPRAWYAKLRLRVVSYALPALIAIGLVRFANYRNWNLASNALRQMVKQRVLRILHEIQPASGGFLEATPLTSFVTLGLLRAGMSASPVVDAGLAFLENSRREDGSWPIDTNLATWATTLSLGALREPTSSDKIVALSRDEKNELRTWLLGQQYRSIHPFTQAAPGGWAWTNLSGGVPDSDDTPGAMLALGLLANPTDPEVRVAAKRGALWLLGTQNRDGGMPTFCRGWGQLPFDRSSADLTAHALRAWKRWYPELDSRSQTLVEQAAKRGVNYLLKQQQATGAWVPLWFGNQYLAEEENPVYGTSRVLLSWVATRDLQRAEWDAAALRAWRWLLDQQNSDGGWGGGRSFDSTVVREMPTTIEETGLALESLAECYVALKRHAEQQPLLDATQRALLAGGKRLLELTDNGTRFPASPIGFYFAKLWYFETTYPMVFALNALRGLLRALREGSTGTNSGVVE